MTEGDSIGVNQEVCKKCKENLENLINGVGERINEIARVSEKREDAHAIDIKEVSRRTDRLTDLMETLVPRVKLLEDEQEQLRIEAVKKETEDRIRQEYEGKQETKEEHMEERRFGTKEKVLMALWVALLSGCVTYVTSLLIHHP